MPILEFLDYAGVAIFAATGALSISGKASSNGRPSSCSIRAKASSVGNAGT